MLRTALPWTIALLLTIFGAWSQVQAGSGPSLPSTDFCYGDQLSVEVIAREYTSSASQTLELECITRSGKRYGFSRTSVTHDEIEGIAEYNGAGATGFKAILSAALLAQSQGRDVRVEFSSGRIRLIPRGHIDFDNPPSRNES